MGENNYRTRVVEAGKDDEAYPSAQSGVAYSRPCPIGFLNIAEDGDSTASLGNLCHCLATLHSRKVLIMSEWYLLYFSFVPLVLSLCHREESCSAFFTPPHQAFSDVSSDFFLP